MKKKANINKQKNKLIRKRNLNLINELRGMKLINYKQVIQILFAFPNKSIAFNFDLL